MEIKHVHFIRFCKTLHNSLFKGEKKPKTLLQSKNKQPHTKRYNIKPR